MTGVSHIVQIREKRRKIAARNPAGRLGIGCGALVSLGAVAAILAFALIYTVLVKDLPSIESIPSLLEPPRGKLLQPTRLYDRSGQHLILELQPPGIPDRHYLSLPAAPDAIRGDTKELHESEVSAGELPHSLIHITLAVADPGFWAHPGFLIYGIDQGLHPTLAQRLVSDLLLWDQPPGLERNIRERVLAAQITAHFGREKVLEWYLNSAKYGPMIYGIDSAARFYFDKPASELTLAEAAALAVVGEAPAINPITAPQIVLERQKQLLQALYEEGWISRNSLEQALKASVDFQEVSTSTDYLAPAYSSLVMEQLAGRFDRERLERGGLLIITTLDYDLQAQAACAVTAQIDRLQAGAHRLMDIDGADCQTSRLLPTLPLGSEAPGAELAADVVVLDPSTGQVMALVVSDGSDIGSARLAGHPPGSIITPFIYLTAFTRGLTPASLIWDIPSALPESMQDGYLPEDKFHGPVRLRTAFANDYLAPAVQVLAQVGPENVWRTLQQMGASSLALTDISGYLQRLPLLSGGEATLLEMSQAYGVLANQGLLVGQTNAPQSNSTSTAALSPMTVLKVIDTEGQTWLDCQGQSGNCSTQTRPVLSPQLAYLVTHVLSDETARWASLGHPNPLEIGRPAAAKIGRNADQQGAWTIGYTPNLVAGVWLGSAASKPEEDERSPAQGSTIVDGAAGLWHAILQYANRDVAPGNWPLPAGVNRMEVCDPSGMLPTINCPTIVGEIFLSGTEPTHHDTLYRALQINRETGRLATAFTPANLIEERVYLIAPPEAVEWAKNAGLPMPPEDYDVVYAPVSSSGDVHLASPGMFTYAGGVVTIRGTAGGEGFAFYRLQVGIGLNPRTWIQVGEDVYEPVLNGTLGEWDTQGLSGLYALQLLVVRQDQRVEHAIVQVTVDNEAPEVKILHPQPEQRFTVSQGGSLVFQVEASDEVSLANVEFYVDGKRIATVSEAPFTVAWQALPGAHSLLVRANDMAKNGAEATVEFTVETEES